MDQKTVMAVWGMLYGLCTVFGFLPEPEGAAKIAGTVLSVVFFLPPVWLLVRGNEKARVLVRKLAALSLGLTVLTLMANFALAVRSEALGNALHILLVVVSSPMICSGYWVLSLFLWACLLISGGNRKK